MDISNVMRQIKLSTKKLNVNENVEVFYEKRITPFGNSANIDAPKKIHRKKSLCRYC
jgi:Putative transposon-encoded protein